MQLPQAAEVNRGSLIIADGSRILRLNLSDGRVETLFKRMGIAEVGEHFSSVEKFSETKLLVGDNVGEGRIYTLDIASQSLNYFTMGRSPVYLSEVGKLVWSAGAFYLAVASANDIEKTKKRIGEWTSAVAIPVIKLSESKVLFSNRDQSGTLSVYDARSDTVQALPIKDCFPNVWREATSELMCQSFVDNEHYLIDLFTSRRQQLPLGKFDQPVVYVPLFDSLVFSRPVTRVAGEFLDLYLYSFRADKSERLLQGVRVYRGQAVWVP